MAPGKFLRSMHGTFGWSFLTTPLSLDTNIIGVDQVRRGPPVKVILGQALLGEAFIFSALPRGLGRKQRFEADAFVIAEVIPLIELVPAAKFRTDGVPHQFH